MSAWSWELPCGVSLGCSLLNSNGGGLIETPLGHHSCSALGYMSKKGGKKYSHCMYFTASMLWFQQTYPYTTPLHHWGLHDGFANGITLVEFLCCGKNFNYFNYCFWVTGKYTQNLSLVHPAAQMKYIINIKWFCHTLFEQRSMIV